jgi:hypothetical protein
MRRLLTAWACVLLTAPTFVVCTPAGAAPPSTSCRERASASTGNGHFQLYERLNCDAWKPDRGDPHARGSRTGPLTETLDCGAPRAAEHLTVSANHFCSDVQAQCAAPAAAPLAAAPPAAAPPPVTTLGFLVQNPDGSWRLTGFNCAAGPGAVPPPTVTPFDAFAEVTKRVPHPPIGAAPGRGQTLVNMQTIFWVNTAADPSLGTAVLLGHQVGLRIHARSVGWDFGDGARAELAGLGRPYTGADQCPTAECPGFDGHRYVTTGSFTVAATVVWAGQFQVDGAGWRDIADPATGANTVTGPATTTPVRVFQARGMLVPDPATQ